VKQPGQTTSTQNRLMTKRIAALVRKAGRLANQNRKKGYH
jgi:hypothetical protein